VVRVYDTIRGGVSEKERKRVVLDDECGATSAESGRGVKLFAEGEGASETTGLPCKGVTKKRRGGGGGGTHRSGKGRWW